VAQAPQFSDTIDDIVLAADTLLRVAIPAGAGFVALSFDADTASRRGSSTPRWRSPRRCPPAARR